MTWLAKVLENNAPAARKESSAPRGPGPVAATPPVRPSNGLKEFLSQLSEVQHGALLDLGPIWQSTISFFLERGFRVSTEDVLRARKEFAAAEEQVAHVSAPPQEVSAAALDPATRAVQFLSSSLCYPAESFDAILVWDLFDYLHAELCAPLAAHLHHLLRPGGAVFAIFYSRAPERFHRYRVSDGGIEMIPAIAPVAYSRAFQNREILNLFAQFRSSKTFVGRDQFREGLFLK
jgi:hypothetical protein